MTVESKRQPGTPGTVNYETAVYEGYGPCGIAIIVKTLTDNRNRTAANVGTLLPRDGASGTAGCVSYMFERRDRLS